MMTPRRPEPDEDERWNQASGDAERWAGKGYPEDDAAQVAKKVTGESEFGNWSQDEAADQLNLSGDDVSQHERDAAYKYLQEIGLDPTPDAVEQLDMVFRKCLTIMCERGWDPEGGTWRRSGRLGALADARKKFERLWERLWIHGKQHDDSALDLINYVGFVLRSDKSGFGEWGEPG